MIAKIGHGTSIMGALFYNQQKVDKEDGEILLMNRMRESPDGRYSTGRLYSSFEPYLVANKRTEKPALHISLNPDPGDRVTDDNFMQIAQDYMQQMGYGDQPYVVFKHTDTGRTHIHIVSTCVDRFGKKIPDTYEKLRSMDACRALEEKYNLTPAVEKQRSRNEELFRPVNYKAGDIKSQMAAVVRYLPKSYLYQSLGAYNALLSLFNITAEEVKGEIHGKSKRGLVYFALNEQGEKGSNPFKASLFGKQTGMDTLEQRFTEAKQTMKDSPTKSIVKNSIEAAMHMATSETDFKKQLVAQGINTVIRRTDDGRIYGMTFIDHANRTVWNGSQLGKHLSARVFNDWWNNLEKRSVQETDTAATPKEQITPNMEQSQSTYSLFDFLDAGFESSKTEAGVLDALGGLLPEVQGGNPEELAFEHELKKKKRKKYRNL